MTAYEYIAGIVSGSENDMMAFLNTQGKLGFRLIPGTFTTRAGKCFMVMERPKPEQPFEEAKPAKVKKAPKKKIEVEEVEDLLAEEGEVVIIGAE